MKRKQQNNKVDNSNGKEISCKAENDTEAKNDSNNNNNIAKEQHK